MPARVALQGSTREPLGKQEQASGESQAWAGRASAVNGDVGGRRLGARDRVPRAPAGPAVGGYACGNNHRKLIRRDRRTDRPGMGAHRGRRKGPRALERDDQGRATLCASESDAKVRTVKSTVRFTYEGPTTLTWRQEEGELKSVDGSWKLEDLGGDQTRVTYDLEVDLGRMLGMVIRGPLVDLLRGML